MMPNQNDESEEIEKLLFDTIDSGALDLISTYSQQFKIAKFKKIKIPSSKVLI
ncbi:hypothetical protein [Scytonema sp. NUACC26]|uniref:hypothetical protein n=1 Tax=Scytonema sp. NUACC26 TaxID=3140176 RepID=UPI0034DCC449